MAAPDLPEHWFRHEVGRLVSVLSRRFGVHRLELCEDAAQTALLHATRAWCSDMPDEPSAWLYRVAHNAVLDLAREELDARGTDRNHRRRVLRKSVDETCEPLQMSGGRRVNSCSSRAQGRPARWSRVR